MVIEENYIPQSADEWKSWLTEQEKTNIEVYLKQPQRLIQDYNTEKETTRDYIGREIFELLQNANDAAAEIDQSSRVLIDLTKDCLIVANTGEPFSIGGVLSLLFSHISPKKKRKNLIGQKGLGFRSVLNWCKRPVISSGHLNLLYQDAKRQNILDILLKESKTIHSLVEKEKEYPDELLIPTLPFPSFFEFNPATDNHLFRQMNNIRSLNYDTVIGIPFDNTDYNDEAKKQLESLHSAIMLFASSLEDILIRIDGEISRHWKIKDRDKQNKTVKIQWHDSSEIVWNVYEMGGVISESEGKINNDLRNEYSIVIAIPQNQNVDISTPLFSFFPLELTFPYPLFCHLTLELENNRKHPRPSESNIKILKQLTKFLAVIASQQDVKTDPWSRIRLLSKRKELDKFLSDIEFNELLIEEAKSYELIPTLSGMHKIASDANRINSSTIEWLPPKEFYDIAFPPPSKEMSSFYGALGIEYISNIELTDRLNKVELSDIDTRAKLIANLIKHNLIPDNPVPNLLIDQSNNLITERSRTFLQSRDQKVFKRPAWLNIQFLNDELKIKMMEMIGLTEVRELRQKLSPFGVNEYSLSSIASALVAEANKRISSEPSKKIETYDDLLHTLFYLFSQRGDASFPEDISVPLRTKAGSYQSARTLYFSESYNANGDWLSELYKLNPEKLLANLSYLGANANDPNYISFFKWIGVSDLPREIILESAENDYKEYVLDSLSYKPDGITVGEYKYKSRLDFDDPKLTSIKSFDGVENFPKADPAALIVWLALDSRCSQMRSNDSSFGNLTDRPYNARKRRAYYGPLPHYSKWIIGNSPWLIITDGSKRKPFECMIGEKTLEKIFPSPARFKHPLIEKYLHEPLMFRRALENAGVIPDIRYLSRNQIKDILITLPEKDPSGEFAGTFYRHVIEEIRTGDLEWDRRDQNSISNCKMWGKGPDGAKYYKVSDLYHTDSQQFPEILTSRLNMIDLPKRYRNEDVKRAFGIKSLDPTKLSYTEVQFEERPESESLHSQFNQIKHLFLALRPSKTVKLSEKSNLSKLRLITCSKIEVCIVYETNSIKTQFKEPYKWIVKDGMAFLLVPDTHNASLRSALYANCLGQIVANIFNLENNSDFSRIIQSDEADRLELLRTMLGEDKFPELDKLKHELYTHQAELPPVVIPPLSSNKQIPEAINGASGPTKSTLPSETTSSVESPQPISSGTVKISTEKHKPTPPKKQKEVVRKKESVSNIGDGKTRRVTNWKRCEDIAVAFEESDERYPIKVSDVVGYKGPKCDILSFSTAEQLAEFQTSSGDKKNINNVVRFIEVKGSVNEKGIIDLKGNELTAARLYNNKYYLYRMYEKTQNDYYVLIVANPLNHKEALEEIWEVIPDRATDASRFHIEIEIEEL